MSNTEVPSNLWILILFYSILFYSILFYSTPLLWAQWQSRYSLAVSQVYEDEDRVGVVTEETSRGGLSLSRWMFPLLASGWRYFTGWTLRTPQLFSPQDEEGCCHAECPSHTLVWAFRQRLLPLYSQVHHLWQHCLKRCALRYSYIREDTYRWHCSCCATL